MTEIPVRDRSYINKVTLTHAQQRSNMHTHGPHSLQLYNSASIMSERESDESRKTETWRETKERRNIKGNKK